MRGVLLLAALGLACTLHGDGRPVTIKRKLPGFTTVEVFDNFTTQLTIDPALSEDAAIWVSLTGEANALRRLFTLVHGEGTLSVAVDPNKLTELNVTPELRARVPALQRAYAEDEAVLEISGAGGELSLAARESATVTLDAAAGLTLTASVLDEAHLIVVGEGPALTLNVEGGATVDAGSFSAAKVTVIARGDGEVRVCATAAITIRGPGSPQVVLACE